MSEGGTASGIARISKFLTDKPHDHSLIREANDEIFNGQNPAMTWLYVEIEAIAAVSEDKLLTRIALKNHHLSFYV